jgi:hypothetical protein
MTKAARQFFAPQRTIVVRFLAHSKIKVLTTRQLKWRGRAFAVCLQIKRMARFGLCRVLAPRRTTNIF